MNSSTMNFSTTYIFSFEKLMVKKLMVEKFVV